MNKYIKLLKLGEGSYGMVYKCKNRYTGDIVAIKKFLESDENPIIRKITLREIRLLKKLKHPNLINLLEIFHRKRRLHLVFEFCEYTLLDKINQHAKFGCPNDFTKKVIRECLQGLSYCHALGCIHRDIKPENILLTTNYTVKLCDFGFARILSPGENYTDYVATRWYRAPELLVGDTLYGMPVDIWAIGCVMAELIRGQVLWPGKSDIDQLYLITITLGDLNQKHLKIMQNNHVYKKIQIPQPNKLQPLHIKLPRATNVQLDFLYKCFEKNPDNRSSCSQLLGHEYLQRPHYYAKSSISIQKSKDNGFSLPNIVKKVFPNQTFFSVKKQNDFHLPSI